MVAHAGVLRVVLGDALGLTDGLLFRLDQARRRQVDWLGVPVVRVVNAAAGLVARPVAAPATAVLLTVGSEIVSGDVESYERVLARPAPGRAGRLGAPDPRAYGTRSRRSPHSCAPGAEGDVVIVTGGLGGTRGDLTREAVAAAFGVPTVEQERSRPSCASGSRPGGWASTQPAGPACRAA